MSERQTRILVVDDDPDIRDVIRVALADSGYDVVVADNAESGLRSYREARPDAVIVDLMMEEVDSGTRFVRELRGLGEMPPVFMISSVADSLSDAVEYDDLGLSGVFQKPIDFGHLTSVLRARLG